MSSPRLSADARRQQILDVAIDEFGRSGYFGTSMNDIAEAAGVTKPVLYQHFDSKADLYRALLDEVGTRLIETIAKATTEAADGRDHRTRLRRLLRLGRRSPSGVHAAVRRERPPGG